MKSPIRFSEKIQPAEQLNLPQTASVKGGDDKRPPMPPPPPPGSGGTGSGGPLPNSIFYLF